MNIFKSKPTFSSIMPEVTSASLLKLTTPSLSSTLQTRSEKALLILVYQYLNYLFENLT